MTWASWQDFFAMGGYGFYVWGSYLVMLVCIAGEIALAFNRRRTSLKHLSLMHGSTKRDKNETST